MPYLIELQYEDKKILVEAEPRENEIEEMGAKEQLKKVKATVGAISDMVATCAKEVSKALESFGAEATRPKSTTLELGVKFTGSGNVYVVKAAADAALKIILKWE